MINRVINLINLRNVTIYGQVIEFVLNGWAWLCFSQRVDRFTCIISIGGTINYRKCFIFQEMAL